MTSIAYDGYDLAADGRITCGNLIKTETANKIVDMSDYNFRGDKCTYFVGSGSCEELAILRNTIYTPECYSTLHNPLENIEAYLFTEGGIYHHEGRVWVIEDSPQFGAGSGKDYVLSALLLGLNAKNAIKHACKLDKGSGGKIQIVSINRRPK